MHPHFLRAFHRIGEVNPYDLAVITVPPRPGRTFRKVAPRGIRPGDPITLVGYGANQFSMDASGRVEPFGGGVLRIGYNRATRVLHGMIEFIGVARNEGRRGRQSSNGHGDSGGPMFNRRGDIVGVTSGGEVRRVRNRLRTVARHVDLNSESSRGFLQRFLGDSDN